jgi:class 3 adenylate cyclase
MKHKEYRLAAVMFTDIVGFSRMMEEDEAGTLRTLDFHNRMIESLVKDHNGVVIKTIGDAFLARFDSAQESVQCSINIQKKIDQYNQSPTGKPLELRIGVHLGDIYFYENDALGEGINIASRLQSASKPGRITISREVYSQVSGKIPMKVTSLGQVSLKNITREIHGYEINPFSDEDKLVETPKERGTQQSSGDQSPGSKPSDKGASGTRTFSPSAEEARNQRVKNQENNSTGKSPTFLDLKTEFGHFKDMIGERFGGAWARGRSRRAGMPHKETRDRHRGPGSWSSSDWEDKIEGALERIGSWFSEDKTPDNRTPYEKYRDSVNRSFNKKKGSFWKGLSSFIFFGGLSVFLNYFLGLGSYEWSIWVLGAFSAGAIGEGFEQLNAIKKKREIDSLPELNTEETTTLQEYHKSRGSMLKELGGFFAMGSLVGAASYMHALEQGWAVWLFVFMGFLGMGVVGKIGSFFSTKGRLKDKLANLFGKRRVRNVTPVKEPESVLDHAKMLKANILEQAKKHKETKALLGDDIIPLLDTYVNQIGQLSLMEEEVANIINEMPMKDLEKDEVRLQMKKEKASSAALIKEYDKSIAEIDRQRKSFDSLKEQKEIISLRMNSSINSLKQMQIDIARMRSIRDGGEGAGLKMLKEKSQELHDYIEDFQEGLREL